ncbi:hypothetical protein [Croceicoccus mobilis]|uniref:Uncharacterized protein n=1 Tax=Croceicoccus mobilis TaxID=1703339 RepID=A0A916YZM5_9SPHN|nr:hypothetical protein [Croceicoccus mobilis]GGD68898.1 hypothetical protein GCM10010990_18060 [Croceicoccus mobilis]
MKKALGCGCAALVLVVLGAAALIFALAQSDAGQWMMGLILVYGGAMLAGALAHDVVTGEVTDIYRSDVPGSINAGAIEFAYEDTDGIRHVEKRRVMYDASKFQTLRPGDPIEVWVCKNERGKVKLVGYGTYEPETCGALPGGRGQSQGAADQAMDNPP